jgi:hypothetical protein
MALITLRKKLRNKAILMRMAIVGGIKGRLSRTGLGEDGYEEEFELMTS